MRKLHLWVIVSVSVATSSGSSALAAQLFFTPRATVTQEYNDNIDLDRKDKKDDFITTVTVGGTLEWLGQLSGLRLAYDPGFSFYADNDEYDGWRHQLVGSAWHNFSRQTRLDLSNYFLYTKDPLADDDVENDRGDIIVRGNDRQRERDTYFRNDATARLSHQFGVENSTFAQFRYGILKYDDPTEEDSQEFSPSAGVTYWFSTWTGMELEGIYTRGLYDESDSSDFNNYMARMRLNQRFSQRYGVFDPAQFVLPEPTLEAAQEALRLLQDLLAEFHFVRKEEDRSAAISAILSSGPMIFHRKTWKSCTLTQHTCCG